MSAWTTPFGSILTPQTVPSHYEPCSVSLRPRLLALARYDAGSTAYRYHSAANTVTGGVSTFARLGHDSPFCDLRQYDIEGQRAIVDELFNTAHIVLVHGDYEVLDQGMRRWHDRARQMLVRHYHGAQPRHVGVEIESFVKTALDDDLGAVQLGSRPDHKNYSPRMHWIPNPMPIADYQALRAKHWVPIEERERKVLRVCHSPTHPRIKGTIEMEETAKMLERKGLGFDLIICRDMAQADVLPLKASCDITFDSFWLGLQGSGLEAAAMGQAVIAGDTQARDAFIRETGGCPYTFAGAFSDFADVLERLIVDPEFRASEARRAETYVRQFHDYPSVGARYWHILQHELTERGYGTT